MNTSLASMTSAPPTNDGPIAYFLSSHVHVCLADDHVVLLDLHRDQYVALGRADLPTLTSLLPQLRDGNAANAAASRLPIGDDVDDGLLVALLEERILTTDPSAGHVSPASTPPALPTETLAGLSSAHTLMESPTSTTRSAKTLAFANVLYSYVVATCQLRFSTIEKTVVRVRNRRRKAPAHSVDMDLPRTRKLLALYESIRPLVFTSKDRCLLDALVLIEFLSRYRLYPTWVFGVRTGPFEAHCWVQHGSTVLNDTVEHARGFAPIMAA